MQKSAEEILKRIDVLDLDQREHFVEMLAIARATCPVVHSDAYGGHYFVTRWEDVRTVCEHPEIYSSHAPAISGPIPMRNIPIDTDPPEHRKFRQLLNPYFSRNFLLRHEGDMRDIARAAIATFLNRMEFDFVEDYAIPFSAGSLARIVLVTENRDLVARGVEAVKYTSVTNSPEAFAQVAEVAMEAMAEVEANPSGREDVLAAIVAGTMDGEPLTTEVRLGIITNLLLGGLDTTRGMIANIGYQLATREDIESRLRSPDWWRGDLDEFLRFEPTVAFMARTVTTDTELAGTKLAAGDRVVVSFYSANRDESRFPDGDRLDLDREPSAHAAFGFGLHRCLGLNFARIQIAIAFEELLKVAKNFRLKPGAEIPRQMASGFNSPEILKVTFDWV